MGDLTLDGKLALIRSLETAYVDVERLVLGAEPEELRFVPPVLDAWSINDFLVHFLDADLCLAFRSRTAIAEAGKEALAWDEEAWHDHLAYEAEDGMACLALAKGIRAFLGSSLRGIAEADWSGFWIILPSRGRTGLAELLSMHDRHVAYHLPLIRRNLGAWRIRRT